ncbi:MAG: RNA polymerase sigma factor [Alphaproteobacteria bacterium]
MGASGQNLAVEELYLRHHAALRRFLARMLRCEETAAEVAQEAWLRLIRLAPGRTVDEPRAYLFQVAANAARDRMARDRTSTSVIDGGPVPEVAPCAEPDAETAAIARERLSLLADAVDELTPRCREVFLMSRLDGLTNGEIAARLGISRNMVEKHIIRAMLHCRRRLDAAGK